jgi:FkbM family methyltransferase
VQLTRTLTYIWHHPANRGRRVAAIARAMGWQFYKRATHRYVDIDYAGLTLRCHPDSTAASAVLYCNGNPDYDEMGFMRRYLRAGDHFLDVGANVGTYTLLAKSLVGAGRVIAIEPDARAFARLSENITLNGLTTVTCLNVAVGATAGETEFLADADTMNRVATGTDARRATVRVARNTLDSIVAKILADAPLAMAKMDIEGYEPQALRGAQQLLAAGNPPVWLLELNGSTRAYGVSEEEFARWLGGFGYRLALYRADTNTLNLEPRAWEHASNVFAIHETHLERVRARLAAGPP